MGSPCGGVKKRQTCLIPRGMRRGSFAQRREDCKNLRKWLTRRSYFCYTGYANPPCEPMTISLNLPPATVHELEVRSAATGKDISTLVTEAVQADIALSKVTLKDVLVPMQDAIASSGMTPDETERFLAQQLANVRAERGASRRTP